VRAITLVKAIGDGEQGIFLLLLADTLSISLLALTTGRKHWVGRSLT